MIRERFHLRPTHEAKTNVASVHRHTINQSLLLHSYTKPSPFVDSARITRLFRIMFTLLLKLGLFMMGGITFSTNLDEVKPVDMANETETV